MTAQRRRAFLVALFAAVAGTASSGDSGLRGPAGVSVTVPLVSSDEPMSAELVDVPAVGGVHAVIEGDILVGRVNSGGRAAVLGALAVPAQEASDVVRKRRRLDIQNGYSEYYWPMATVYYVIDGPLNYPASPLMAQRIQDAITHITARTFVRFIQNSTNRAHVRFAVGSMCSSSVGRLGGEQLVTLTTDGRCTFGTVVHEIGHALGLLHTVSRRDRDAYVTINSGNIQPGALTNFRKYSSLCFASSFCGSDVFDYDYFSVMHYSPTAFSVSTAPTIVANEVEFSAAVTQTVGTREAEISFLGQRSGFSGQDIELIGWAYNSCINDIQPDRCSSVIISGFQMNSTLNGVYSLATDTVNGFRHWVLPGATGAALHLYRRLADPSNADVFPAWLLDDDTDPVAFAAFAASDHSFPPSGATWLVFNGSSFLPETVIPVTCQSSNLRYSWVVGQWGRCNPSCPAIKARQVVCRASNGICADPSLCPGAMPPTQSACSFQFAPTCDFQSTCKLLSNGVGVGHAAMEWRLASGSEFVSGGGPARDHSIAGTGGFVVTDTGDAVLPGARADLTSRALLSGGLCVVSFYYYSFGRSDLASLRVALVAFSNVTKLLWRSPNVTTADWTRVSIQLPPVQGAVAVSFIAIPSLAPSAGGYALDDVSFVGCDNNTQVPSIPTNVFAQRLSNGMISIWWTCSLTAPGYPIVAYYVTEVISGRTVKIVGSPPRCSATLPGVAKGTQVAFVVVAENTIGNSSASDFADRPEGAPTVYQPPNANECSQESIADMPELFPEPPPPTVLPTNDAPLIVGLVVAAVVLLTLALLIGRWHRRRRAVRPTVIVRELVSVESLRPPEGAASDGGSVDKHDVNRRDDEDPEGPTIALSPFTPPAAIRVR